MKTQRWIVAVFLSFFTACSYVDGQCWLRSEEGAGAGEGVGGGVVGPYGAGGYGDAELDPQASAEDLPPDCISRQYPADRQECYEQCAYQYGRDIEACSRKKDKSKRAACYEKANQDHAKCRRECEKKFPGKE